jgi:queuine tRNA-ribosyltransferase
VTAPVRFELVATEEEARRGRLITPHGAVDTPAFMPVATQGSVKSLDPGDLRSAGAQIILANTYHLHLRPGHELVRDLGGLHRFMGWEGPILTDSGGFQVFSLSKLRRLGEEGVEFRSHLDGSVRLLTPEICMDIQHALGVDILHPLDECLPHAVSFDDTERSLALTVRWLERAVARHRAKDSAGALFGIVQGGGYEALRRRAVEETCRHDLPGYAIGGLAVGETKARLYDITQLVASHLPVDRPRYLMGVGKPVDLIEAVARGVDLFDCVLPTRNARNGQAFTAEGTLTITQARFARDAAPLDAECPCLACRSFSRAYLRHLFMARELLAYRLLSLHNVTFYLGLMRSMRDAVAAHAFSRLRSRFLDRYAVESGGGSHPTSSAAEA